MLQQLFIISFSHDVQLQMSHNQNQIKKLRFHTLADSIPLRKAQTILCRFPSTHSHGKALAEKVQINISILKPELHHNTVVPVRVVFGTFPNTTNKWPQTHYYMTNGQTNHAEYMICFVRVYVRKTSVPLKTRASLI